MTATVNRQSQSKKNLSACEFSVGSVLANVRIVAIGTIARVAVAAIFTTIHPAGALIFGCATALSMRSINVLIPGIKGINKIARIALRFFGVGIIGSVVATAAGFPISIGTGILLNIAGMPVAILGSVLYFVCRRAIVAPTPLKVGN